MLMIYTRSVLINYGLKKRIIFPCQTMYCTTIKIFYFVITVTDNKGDSTHETDMYDIIFTLVRTKLNYSVLKTNTAAVFLSNDHSLYAPFSSDECQSWFHLYGTSRTARSSSKVTKYKMKLFVYSGTWTHNLEIGSLMLYSLDFVKVNIKHTCILSQKESIHFCNYNNFFIRTKMFNSI